jgi:drug/metabolite transporter (DMT)-like permease
MWIILSLSASVLWGLTYVVDEQIYRRISVFSSLAIASLCVFLVMLAASYISGSLGKDIAVLSSSRRVLALVLCGAATLLTAELLIGLSISSKNATLAALIEISYPLFVATFAVLLFNEERPNVMTVVGGVLILGGVFLISYFNL